MKETSEIEERLKRWRIVLGGAARDGTGVTLDGLDAEIDAALSTLYDADEKSKRGGFGASAPRVARWLGDVRKYFPTSVVKLLQKDAIERLDLKHLLKQPELLKAVEPDIHLVANILALKSAMPAATLETARGVVRTVVEAIEARLADRVKQAVLGALDRSTRNRRPRYSEIDWNRTIRANLKHYQPSYRTIVPEIRLGSGRTRRSMRDIVLCVDQSGSMANSVVYAGIMGAVLASLPAVSTRVVVFDTSVVDLTDEMSDPVELLFGVQLGGGTDIARALTYCEGVIARPAETILILISDLFEGGERLKMFEIAARLVSAGVQMICLLSLADDGAPCHDHAAASAFASLGIPVFACTPDLFPEMLAAAIARDDVSRWASDREITTARADVDRFDLPIE